MSAINIDGDDKDWFDDYLREDETHAEGFNRLRRTVMAFDGEPVDVEGLADELEASLVSKIEVGAYRGCVDAMERNGDKYE